MDKNEILEDAVTAIYRGNLDILEIYMDMGLDVNSIWNGRTLLHIAVEGSRTKIVKLLLDKGADVNAEDNRLFGKSPLQKAVSYENKEMVEILLGAGANKTNILHEVVETGNEEFTKLLLNRGAKVNIRNKYGESPLHKAVKCPRAEEMVKILLDAGAKVNAKNKLGQSALYIAFWVGRKSTKVKELLISKGAKIKIKTKFGNTPLYEAALLGNGDLVKILLKKGARVNAALRDGKTPLYVALSNNKNKIAELLLENGADVNVRTTSGQTILYQAVRKGNVSMVKLLITIGVDVNAKTEDDRTALHQAIYNNRKETSVLYKEIVDILLENNADIHARTNDGTSVLAMAIRRQNKVLAKVLLNNEIDVNTRSSEGMTPLLEAAKHGDKELVEILLEKGADIGARTDYDATVLYFATIKALDGFFLHQAATAKQNDISFATFYTEKTTLIKILLDNGADINNTFVFRCPILMIAIQRGRKDIVKILLANGANININAIDLTWGKTALHEAAALGLRKLVENLLSKGAKVNARSTIGETPLHSAVESMVYSFGGDYISHGINPLLVKNAYYHVPNTELYSPNILGVLLKYGANLEAENKYHETPLFYSVKRNLKPFVEFLLNNGANINHKSERGITCVNTIIYVGNQSYNVLESMLNLLRQHIIKRKCARLFINKENLKHFPFGMLEYQTECCKEIINIKNKVLYNDISLYDVLIKTTKQLASYLRNDNFVLSIKLNEYEAKFPKYYEMIKCKIQNGLRLKELLIYGERFLISCVYVSLKNLSFVCCTVSDRILSYLSNEDLVTLEIILKGIERNTMVKLLKV